MKKRPVRPFTTVLSEDLALPARQPSRHRLTSFTKRDDKRPAGTTPPTDEEG